MQENSFSLRIIGKVETFIRHKNTDLYGNYMGLYRMSLTDNNFKNTRIECYNENEMGEIIIDRVRGTGVTFSHNSGGPVRYLAVYLDNQEILINLEDVDVYLMNVTTISNYYAVTRYDKLTLVHFNFYGSVNPIDYKEDDTRYIFRLKDQSVPEKTSPFRAKNILSKIFG